MRIALPLVEWKWSCLPRSRVGFHQSIWISINVTTVPKCMPALACPPTKITSNQIRRFICFKQNDYHRTMHLPAAIAKIHIESGERIKVAPALVLSRRFVENTVLSPLCFYWEDLVEQHHASLIDLRESGQFKVQYQSPFTEWRRVDRFEGFEASVIFPAAGFIGMVERVGTDNPNCRMEVKSSGSGAGSAGLVLEVIALINIEAGEVLRLNISPTGSVTERLKMVQALEMTGQPISTILQKVKRDEKDDEL